MVIIDCCFEEVTDTSLIWVIILTAIVLMVIINNVFAITLIIFQKGKYENTSF